MKFALLLAAFVGTQFAVLLICVSRLRRSVFRSPLAGAALVFIIAQGLAVVSLVLGAYVETRWQALNRLGAFLQEYPAPPRRSLARDENPGLLATLDAQRPAFSRPDSNNRDAFESWQRSLRDELLDSVFEIPHITESEAVAFTFEEETQLKGGIVRKFLHFTAFDDVEIPAYLFVPRHAQPLPGILVIPGHVRESQSGIAQTAGLVESYQNSAALELAKAGFVALTFELRGFGLLGAPYLTEHRLVAYNAILAGTFYKAVIAKDIKKAVDLLQSLPEVESSRLGVTGASYGGELAVAYGALDNRIKVIVFSSYGGTVGNFRGKTGTKDDQPHYCHIIPGANALMRHEDIFLLLAPKPTLGVRGDQDSFRDPNFADRIQVAWDLLGKPNNLLLRESRGRHEYFVEPAVEFFRIHLGSQ